MNPFKTLPPYVGMFFGLVFATALPFINHYSGISFGATLNKLCVDSLACNYAELSATRSFCFPIAKLWIIFLLVGFILGVVYSLVEKTEENTSTPEQKEVCREYDGEEMLEEEKMIDEEYAKERNEK